MKDRAAKQMKRKPNRNRSFFVNRTVMQNIKPQTTTLNAFYTWINNLQAVKITDINKFQYSSITLRMLHIYRSDMVG